MKSKKHIIISILVILWIFIKGYLFSTKYVADDYIKEYTVFIESLKSKSETKVSYNVNLLNTNDKFILNIYDNSYDNIYTDLSQYANYTYGDVIKIKGKISIPKKLNNPGEFNYKLYLYSNNIYGLINSYESPEEVNYQKTLIDNIYAKVYTFKGYIKELIKSSMSETNASTAIAMIYGDTTSLDENVKQDFESVGVSHLMSVSGTHVASFMLIVNYILGIDKVKKIKNNRAKEDRTSKIKKLCKLLIKIICTVIYVVFTGFAISVVRATIMLIIYVICDYLDIKNNSYLALLLTLVITLINTPYAIFNTGLQLSYLATLGIIAFRKHIIGLFNKLVYKIKNKYIKEVGMFIIQNIAITISVQLLIIPIQIHVFNKLSFPVIIPNLLMGTLAIPIQIIGTIGILFSFIPSISILLFKITEIFVMILLQIANILKTISFNIATVSMPAIFFTLYYIFVLGLLIYFKLNSALKEQNGKGNTNLNLNINLSKLIKCIKYFELVLASVLVVLIVSFNIYSVCFSQYVYFFNVEQGDMSYIKCGKASVIVDIGSLRQKLAYNTISNYFKTINITAIDAVIISHMHEDHINGLEQLLENYIIYQVIYAKPKEDSEAFRKFKAMLKKYNIDSKEVKAGEMLNIGGIKIEILFPGNNYIDEDEVNSNSLVCKVSVNGKEMLYMGDASKETEQVILKEYIQNKKGNLNNIYILKVGHHGSKTATSEKFIQQIKPKHAVISALKKYYGHPHKDTIDTLNQNNVYTYLIEKQGAIKFSLR